MTKFLKIVTSFSTALFMSACSVFGNPGVEIAPYTIVMKDDVAEIRTYERLVLVRAPMPGGMEENDTAFQSLFDYISGKNVAQSKIDMTAPVLMQNEKIAMTAPVFMAGEKGSETMAFVLPSKYTLETAPQPVDPALKLEEVKNYTVAAIRFSGLLNDNKVAKQRETLQSWIDSSAYKPTGPYVVAGYNPPWTLPPFRRNEILIPVDKK